jgi:hypothetical protein
MNAKSRELSYTTPKGVPVSVVLAGCVVTISGKEVHKRLEIVNTGDVLKVWSRIQELAKDGLMDHQQLFFEIDEYVDCKKHND